MSSNLLHEARLFATAAHDAIGQVRKYTGEPYWNHCRRVVTQVSHLGNYDLMAAAWLHDVVEDTKVSIETIQDEFGSEIAQLVSEVTNVAKPGDGVRSYRHQLNLAHLAKASSLGMSLKLADTIDNLQSIVRHDPSFAAVYLKEKALLLPLLKNGCPILHMKASLIVGNGLELIKDQRKSAA